MDDQQVTLENKPEQTEVENKDSILFKLIDGLSPKGKWKCNIAGDSLVLYPFDKDVPNWFWRKMQYLLLGFKWKKNIKEEL